MTLEQRNLAAKLLKKHQQGETISEKERDLLVKYLKYSGLSWNVLSNKCKGCSCD